MKWKRAWLWLLGFFWTQRKLILRLTDKKIFFESEWKKTPCITAHHILQAMCIPTCQRCSIKFCKQRRESTASQHMAVFVFLHFTRLFAGSIRAVQLTGELFCNHSPSNWNNRGFRGRGSNGTFLCVYVCAHSNMRVHKSSITEL